MAFDDFQTFGTYRINKSMIFDVQERLAHNPALPLSDQMSSQPSLDVCVRILLPGWDVNHLHNAGNDSQATMELLCFFMNDAYNNR